MHNDDNRYMYVPVCVRVYVWICMLFDEIKNPALTLLLGHDLLVPSIHFFF